MAAMACRCYQPAGRCHGVVISGQARSGTMLTSNNCIYACDTRKSTSGEWRRERRFRGRTSARLLDGVANQQLGDAVGEPGCVAVRAPTPMSGEAAEDHRIHQQPHGVNGAGSVEP